MVEDQQVVEVRVMEQEQQEQQTLVGVEEVLLEDFQDHRVLVVKESL